MINKHCFVLLTQMLSNVSMQRHQISFIEENLGKKVKTIMRSTPSHYYIDLHKPSELTQRLDPTLFLT